MSMGTISRYTADADNLNTDIGVLFYSVFTSDLSKVSNLPPNAEFGVLCSVNFDINTGFQIYFNIRTGIVNVRFREDNVWRISWKKFTLG